MLNKENIPQELIARAQWVAWAAKTKDNGKVSKLPINPKTGKYAKTNDPTTWGTFEEALKCCTEKGLAGVGYVFSGDDPFVGIDLDDCLDSEGGFEPWASEIVNNLDSYTEISPSGQGVHIYVKGTLPGSGKKNGKIEMYDTGRCFTVTGNHLDVTPLEIVHRDEEIRELYGDSPTKPPTSNALALPTSNQNDDELIRRAMSAQNGRKFRQLWHGDYFDYPSQSVADLALCSLLAFWTGNDSHQIDQLFRKSSLYRSKWDKKTYGNGLTYGQATVQRAIESTGETFNSTYNKETHQPRQSFKPTDLGNAERMAVQFGNDIHYCHAWKSWLIWDGTCWQRDNNGQIHQMAKKAVRSIYVEAAQIEDSSERRAIAKHAEKSESDPRLKAMIARTQSEKGIPINPDELDKQHWLLNCLNGTLDLKSGKLLPQDRKHLLTQVAPVNYDPEAQCPIWDGFLDRILAGNEDLLGFLQRAIGYSLTGNTGEQCLFILYGSGANGKSTFLQAVNAMLGNYSMQTPTETLLIKRQGAISNDVARLKGARMVIASEAELGQRFAEGLIKQMTGQDMLSARFLHQEYFDFMPTHKIFLATNHKPVIKGMDQAIWRRIKLVPFEIAIPEEERDMHLFERLVNELPGILAWAVRGCLSWQQNRLGEPEEVKNATKDYRDEMDIQALFLNDCCVVGESYTVTSKDLYEAYQSWCNANGERPLAQRTFGVRLKEKGYTQGRVGVKGARSWEGLILQTQQPLQTHADTRNNIIDIR